MVYRSNVLGARRHWNCSEAFKGRITVEGSMTKKKWFLLGAMLLGLLVVFYFMLLCPTDCH
jgi:hypothetical protein